MDASPYHTHDSHTWAEPDSDRLQAGFCSAFTSFQENPEAWRTELAPFEIPEAGRALVYTFQVNANLHGGQLIAPASCTADISACMVAWRISHKQQPICEPMGVMYAYERCRWAHALFAILNTRF